MSESSLCAKPKAITDSGIMPLEDRVLVCPLEAEDKSPGGILLPDSARQKPQKGTVIAVGPGKVNDSGNLVRMSVRVGDTVIFTKYSGHDIETDNSKTKLRIMSQDEILAIQK